MKHWMILSIVLVAPLVIFHVKAEKLFVSINEMIENEGFSVERYEVKTEDGYLIDIFRIPRGKDSEEDNSKPLLMMNGMFLQSELFVVINENSLPFIAANNGYDVWLGNTRGTNHGRKHINMTADQMEFWDFSWHEIAMYDLPAIIDFILAKTGKPSLHYIGYSQGGTIFYILASLKTAYQPKIKSAMLLGPAGYMKHFRTLSFKLLTRFQDVLHYLLSSVFEFRQFPPAFLRIFTIALGFCTNSFFRKACSGALRVFMYELEEKNIPKILQHIPGIALKQLLHYGQVIRSGHFRPWDYGKVKNLMKYRSFSPPDYPVEKIETPVTIYYVNDDIFTFPEDAVEICNTMKNCKTRSVARKWSHFDFVFSPNLRQVYDFTDLS